MKEFEYPQNDAQFLLSHVFNIENHLSQIGADQVNDELIFAIVDEASKLGNQVLSPLNWTGDQAGCQHSEEGVACAPGFADAYAAFKENGWGGITFPEEFGGQGLPNIVGRITDEIWSAANISFALCPLLTQGAIEAIKAHGSDELKSAYLEKLISGEWTGTMNLTEPNAGSDLALLRSKAVPEGDHYLITGQKIFITWGEHDAAENIIHLVLARLPDAPAGVKGISLFLVPKYKISDSGEILEKNDVTCTAIEHKLGIHASPTCSMSFGDNGGAVGYLVGEKHNGLACMFTMMNHARQGVGVQGLALSERAYQLAVEYANERKQGNDATGNTTAIINHPDVKRMLLLMQSAVSAMRAVAYQGAIDIDLADNASDADTAKKYHSRVELLTPIIKGWMTELSLEITSLGVQVHGGMGFVEETGAAQHYRDARILPIYEGTTGIQGLDLLFRKTLMNKGQAMSSLLDEIEQWIASTNSSDKQVLKLIQSVSELTSKTKALITDMLNQQKSPQDLQALATNFMMMCGHLVGGWLLAKQGVAAEQLLSSDADNLLYQSKVIQCGFFADHYMTRALGLYLSMTQDTDAVALAVADHFSAA